MQPAPDSDNMPAVALFMSSLGGGGIQRSMVNLACALADQGQPVDLLVCHNNMPHLRATLPPNVRLLELDRSLPGYGRLLALLANPKAWRLLLRPILLPVKGSSKLRYLAALTRYLRKHKPPALISAMTQCNLVAIWAGQLARVPTSIVVSERNILSRFVEKFDHRWRWRHLPKLLQHCYPQAAAVVAVSEAVAEDVARTISVPHKAISVIHNPVVNRQLREAAAQPVQHAWFDPGQPKVILGVCRLVAQKDPTTLLRAFAELRRQRHVRLVILGDGPERATLERLAEELGVASDVDLPGWTDNPFPFMARAGVFVSSSLWEGLPGVLIQAMACGCPVVATDCPGGSAEILAHGQYGCLTPAGDHHAMAAAIRRQLDSPPDYALLRLRSSHFSAEHSANAYRKLISSSMHTVAASVLRESSTCPEVR